jgi:putative ABC transport system permease protein
MFFVTYLRRELRRRIRQTMVIAAGLAVGIGLVVTVTAASAGVRTAQASVLHALYGIGTDVTVTKAPTRVGTSGPKHFFSPGAKAQHQDFLGYPLLSLLRSSAVTSVSRLHGVAAAAGGLTLTDTKLTIPSSAEISSGAPVPAPVSFRVGGVDLAHRGLGPFASGKVTSGRSFASSDAHSNVAIVDANYAKAHKLTAGSAITVAGERFTVIGITRQPQGGGAADVYIPLARAQALAGMTGKVNTIYVAAASATGTTAVARAISRLLPSATVTSSASLAGAVSGSLASAASLATDLGRWLSIAVLIAAFAVASLLTMAAVARRVREFGTLKALGWRSRRIIGQIMGESLVTGVIGAAAGTALGLGGAALVRTLAPKLSAIVPHAAGYTPPGGFSSIGEGGTPASASGPATASTVAVHLTAPVTVTAIVLAVALAIAGALIAGSFGGWRAARLRPAEALGRVA